MCSSYLCHYPNSATQTWIIDNVRAANLVVWCDLLSFPGSRLFPGHFLPAFDTLHDSPRHPTSTRWTPWWTSSGWAGSAVSFRTESFLKLSRNLPCLLLAVCFSGIWRCATFRHDTPNLLGASPNNVQPVPQQTQQQRHIHPSMTYRMRRNGLGLFFPISRGILC